MINAVYPYQPPLGTRPNYGSTTSKTTTTTREYDDEGRVVKETTVVTETVYSEPSTYYPVWSSSDTALPKVTF